jgi:hypothetical protein
MCNSHYARHVDTVGLLRFGLPSALRDRMQEIREELSRGFLGLYRSASFDRPLHLWIEGRASSCGIQMTEDSLAMTSISTRASLGRPATATVERAGAMLPGGARYRA